MQVKLLNSLNNNLIEAGCDEAGRGPLAGPVFAAAVILPEDFHHPLLNDSKKMTEKARETLRPIIEQEAIAWSVHEVSASDIDSINILNASIAGMWRSIVDLDPRPEHLLIDGNRFRPYGLTGDTDSGGFRPCKDLQGRVYEKTLRRISGIRMGKEYGISHTRAHRSNQTARTD